MEGMSDREYRFELWKEQERIAMHFNDLIMKVRIQALGALAAIITVGGVALKFISSEGPLPWGVISAALLVLIVLWCAIWVLDFLYYNRLLMGAVDSLLVIEKEIQEGKKEITLNMSHMIEDSVHGRPYVHLRRKLLAGPMWFYLLVVGVLVFGFLYSAFHCFCPCG